MKTIGKVCYSNYSFLLRVLWKYQRKILACQINANRYFRLIIAGLAACLSSTPAFAWTFGANADWHARDAVYGPASDSEVQAEDSIVNDFRQAGAEFAIVSGDIFNGVWLTPQLKATYGIGSDGNYSLETLISTCGALCYKDIKNRFAVFGLPLIGTVGDHELGDNNWPLGSEKAGAVAFYKRAFAEAFTLNENGTSKYNGSIGGVYQRPIGTMYENTSFAFIQHNILFVSVDIFRFEAGNVALDSQTGVVAMEVEGRHLAWLDDVLAAAKRLAGVRFIIVSVHTPTILPVVIFNSSGILTKNGENSGFWSVIRKHRVDVVLAGEVHAMTPALDRVSGTVQLVHGFKGFSHSHLLFDVSDNKLVVRSREYANSNYGNFLTSGTLTIDKTGGTRQIQGTGALKPIDSEGLIIHYTLNNLNLTTKIQNTGQFWKYYWGLPARISSVSGIIGNAARFSGGLPPLSSYLSTPVEAGKSHWNPIVGGMPRTLACWVNTTSQGIGTLVSLGSGTGEFALRLNNGLPEAVGNNGRIVQVTPTTPVNDGQWHHVVATYPGAGANMDKIVFYVDGAQRQTTAPIPAGAITTSIWGGITIGANQQKSNAFSGLLDDCGIWSSSLSQGMIGALHQAGRDSSIKLDAATMDRVFSVFRTKAPGSAAGKTWYYSSGLSGTPGTITKYSSGDYVIVLNVQGEGITTVAYSRTNLVKNSGFENDFAAWGGVGPGVITASGARSGGKAALFTSSTAYNNYLYQTIGSLDAGTYKAAIWYKQLDPMRWAQLGVKVLDASGKVVVARNAAFSTRSSWAQAVIDNIAVKAGEYIQLNVWIKAGAGGSLYLDDALLN